MRPLAPPLATLALLLLAPTMPADAPPPIGTTTVFAHIPAPGFPEGIAVHDGTVYVGGPASLQFGLGLGASRVWRYGLDGTAQAPMLVEGEDLQGVRGLSNMAHDAQGRLYALNVQGGLSVLRFDGQQQRTYAVIPDIPPCGPLVQGPCSPTLLDRPQFPNDLAFDAAGNLYVTDTMQATVWRIGPGGAPVQAWFQHPGLDASFGPNGLRVGPDGGTLYLALTAPSPSLAAGIYTLPMLDAPQHGDLRLFKELGGVDGIAFGSSGLLYAVLALDNQVVALGSTGNEVLRFPDPASNLQQEVPYDAPATLAFVDERRSILVTNHALFTGNALPQHFAVLEAYVNDTGHPLLKPNVPG